MGFLGVEFLTTKNPKAIDELWLLGLESENALCAPSSLLQCLEKLPHYDICDEEGGDVRY